MTPHDRSFLYGAYTINQYIRFIRARDLAYQQWLKEVVKK